MSSEEENLHVLRRTNGDPSFQNHDENMTELFLCDAVRNRSKQHSITERTSLCDIFGDDSDAPVFLSSNMSSKRDSAEGSKIDDAVCDSSGSYHTALCSEAAEPSSDSSENFEDSKEDLSPEQTDSEHGVAPESHISQRGHAAKKIALTAGVNRPTVMPRSPGQLAMQDSSEVQNTGPIPEPEWRKEGEVSVAVGGHPSLRVASTEPVLISSRSVGRRSESDPTVGGGSCGTTCKEQQVQLSLTAKNRKGPASSSTVLTDREPLLGMPGRCCSECPFSPQRQKPKEQPGSARKQSSHSPSAATHQTRDCASEASSMGSELDEADNEVKWFTDLAFKSLSSPQVDYLDIYNSSYRSSANASRPSTGESCGANVWSAYADLRGSSRTDGNDVIAPDSKEPAEQFEMGNFECEDVALESKDELKRGKRTVPKRQIQLKRRDTSESRASESSESECKPTHRSSERRTQDILLRQHSTPAAIQDGYHKTEDVTIRQDNKKKLQKSVSLDETSSKTKFASCLIKNVLSKKMLYEHKLKQLQRTVRDGQPPVTVTASPGRDKGLERCRETPKNDISDLCFTSGVKSDCSLSSEELSLEPLLPGKLELSNQNVTDTSNIILNTTVSAKTHQKPCCKYSFNAFENCVEGAANTKSSNGKQGKRSELVIPCEKRKACTDEGIMKDEAEHNASDNPGQQWRDSASSSTTGRVDVISTARPTRSKSGRTDKEEQHPVNTEKCQQQDPRAIFKSEAPEITLKPNTNDKVWTTLRVACLSPDKETGKVGNGESLRPVSTPGVDQEKNKESDLVETTSYNKGKTLIHKVRDVRKLVKNTYNLSFKAPAAPPQESQLPEPEEALFLPAGPPPVLIECKSISRPESKADDSHSVTKKEEKTTCVSPVVQTRENVSISVSPKTSKIESILLKDMRKTPDKTSVTKTTGLRETPVKMLDSDGDKNSELTLGGIRNPELSDTSIDPPSREREISTLLVLKDGPEETPAAGCLPSSSSHSVSMILKEKGFQADIGVCETSSEDSNSAPKHVNTLEVPLQTCVLKSTGLESGRMETPAEADLPLPQSQTPADLLPPECQAAASDASKEQLTDECSHKSTQDSILQPESRSYGEFSQDLYASDDPPSYDERESFSRLLATDLPPGKPDKYCPAPPKCSCSVATQKSPAPLPSPPAPSPASAWCDSETPESQQAMTSQTQRTDTSALNHPAFPLQAGQMKSVPPAPLHPPSAASFFPVQLESEERRASQRPGHSVTRHKSPQPSHPAGGSPLHQPPKTAQETRQQLLCSPRGFLSPFAAECGSEGLPYPGNVASSAVPCFQYNQSPRKVLLDPETGKYFYIDMPVQPLRKMLYDPETGQYVEVLIPQQALSHSGVYQNPASPYSSFMNPGMYSSPYMPYSGLPMPSHPALPPGHPDLPGSTPHGSAASQNLKPEVPSNQPTEQNYLESMYYIPTGMTASPNPSLPELHLKRPPSSSGGIRRS
nr:PREDICTED: uncharacterized protein LOC102691544 isoform X1 [Lepisosteus oculatus]XP_015205299.1 PREDICTED: uncharacterized protein LOC102691544 isoform X1 [Lepisosteus oculatus]XP_015205300.1 PREDICTED: uncharacterized protein LOC102691544 isoform X1 [Lepisosteus oculatus]XP_015205301.1 PREDICTED: uncharacterized protein LOC102691544 isoform X1 [Lepisosteus oculatus]XP_015205302.1 PREDICTED: uncharacterized protein LOC102691544 isoform X1 [Lepisosteus oculatus]XP_015205303.1 PREDICTED: unch